MTNWYDKETPNKSTWKANTAQQLAIGIEITIWPLSGAFTVSLQISNSDTKLGLLYLPSWDSPPAFDWGMLDGCWEVPGH